MPQNRQLFFILLLSSFVSTLGLGIIVPVLPLYAEQLGASAFWIGLIFSGFSIARFFVMPVVGSLSDRGGRKRYMVAGLFLYACASYAFVFADNPLMLTILRFCQGVAAAMVIPLAQAFAGDLSPERREGKYMGLFSVAVFAGFGAGPLMGGIIMDLSGMNGSLYALALLTLIAGLIVLFFLQDVPAVHRKETTAQGGFFSLLNNSVVRGVVVFRATTAMCRGAIIAFVPLFAHYKLMVSATQIGIIISGNVLVTAILQAPFGLLADRTSRKKLVVIGGVFFAGLIALIPFVQTFAQLLVLSVVYGVFGALVLPPATAMMVSEGRSHGMGRVMSLFNMSMSLGLAVGPMLGGVLADDYGLHSVFYLFSAIGLAGVAFFALSCPS